MTSALQKSLSIIVPVYNTEEQLPRCMGGLLAQMPSDCELILIDDGSSDSSGSLCDSYSEDPRVTVRHQSNKGVSAARNLGMELATGEYIWFVDSDDWIPEGAIDAVLDGLAKTDVDLLCFAENKVLGSGEVLEYLPGPDLGHGPEDGPLVLGDQLYPHSHVFRKPLCHDLKFDETLSLLEDRQFFYQLWLRAEKVASIDKALYCYVVDRRESAVNNQSVEKLLGAQRVAKEIYLSERALGRPDPAYSSYVVFTLMALSRCGREHGIDCDFKALRSELLSYAGDSRTLSSGVRFRFSLVKASPHLFNLACRIKEAL